MENTAKNFALQLGAVIALYVVIVSLISLLFSVITIAFPDPAQGIWEKTGASSTIRTTIAFLIVFLPTYIVLTRILNNIRRSEQGTYLTLTKWILYLSLLIGGGVLLGDLVAVLVQFLNGELTIRFICKSLTVFVVVSTAFAYYLADVRGYWQNHEQYSIYYGVAVSLLVVSSVVLGFGHTESPQEVREIKIDQNQISDLWSIQSQIESYVSIHSNLPETIEDAFEKLPIPKASSDRMNYSYERVSNTQFTLCAEFKTDQTDTSGSMIDEYALIKNSADWNHTAGVWCFDRALNTTVLKR